MVGLTLLQGGLTFEVPREGVETPAEIDLQDARRHLGTYEHPAFERLHAPDAEGRRVFRVNDELHVVFREEADVTVTGLTFVERGVASECPQVGAAEASGVLTLEELHALRRSEERARALEAAGAWGLRGKVKFVHMGIEGSFDQSAHGTDRHRARLDLSPFGVMEFAYDRGRAESRSDLAEHSPAPTQAEAEWLRVDHPASPFGDWRAWNGSFRVLRADERGGRPTWVDAQTGDTRFEECDQPLPGGAGVLHRVRSDSDFREVQGLRVPFHSTLEDEYTGRMLFEVETFEALGDVAEDAFRLQSRGGRSA